MSCTHLSEKFRVCGIGVLSLTFVKHARPKDTRPVKLCEYPNRKSKSAGGADGLQASAPQRRRPDL